MSLSKYSNSKYKSKYLKYKNKYLEEKNYLNSNQNSLQINLDNDGSNKHTLPILSHDLKKNISNIEISNSNENTKNIKQEENSINKKNTKKNTKKTPSKNTNMKMTNKIYSENIDWNKIAKMEVKKINFTKNKIVIKFDKSALELSFTKTLNETTWFEKFIRVNILDKEPVYNPDDVCNVKISKLFVKPIDEYKKFIEYENLIGKKIKSIKWVGDSWMYPSNKQECDHNHVFKIQTVEGKYYLFILRCSSIGGIDSNLIIKYKK